MKRLSLLAAVLAACVLALAGGGHTRTITRTIVAPTAAAPAPRCSAKDATLQCVLDRQASPSAANVARAHAAIANSTSVYGIDFGWGAPSVASMRSIGAKFGASYLSLDPSKNWTRAAVSAYHRAGIATVAVWETSATGAEAGFLAGVTDAHTAATQAAALGNTARPIDFAIDCDCAGPAILGYFQGVHSVLGNRTSWRRSRDDAYGGYDQLLYLYEHHLVGDENWQTYAWSSGRWLPASIAPLEQYLNGNAFDSDRAIAPAYGQWPYTSTVAVDPHRYDRLDHARRTFYGPDGHVVARAREDNTVRTWTVHRCLSPARRAACRSSAYHLRLLRGRLLALHAHGHRWSYGKPSSIGIRNQVLWHELQGRRVYATWSALVRG